MSGYYQTWPPAPVSGGGGGSGTVTQVNTGTGLVGGPITTTGTISVASVSLTNQVVGTLPLANMTAIPINSGSGQTTGSLSLTNQVVGNLPFSQTSGSISLTNQVSGLLPLTFMNLSIGSTDAATGTAFGATLGSNSLYLQSAAGSQSGLISTVAQVFGGGDKTFPGNIFSSADGAYSIGTASARFLNGAFGNSVYAGSTTLGSKSSAILHSNLGGTGGTLRFGYNGTIAWTQVYFDGANINCNDSNGYSLFQFRNNANPSYTLYSGANTSLMLLNSSSMYISAGRGLTTGQATIGSVTQTSSAGGAAYTIRLPGSQSSGSSVLNNDGSGNLSWGAASAFTPLAPTFKTLSSGSSLVYTRPTPAPLYLKIIIAGGGGGGGGKGTTGSTGSIGGTTTFGVDASLLSCNSGSPGNGNATGVNGGAGGSATIGSTAFGIAITGGAGGNGAAASITTISVGTGFGGDNSLSGGGAGGGVSGGGGGAGIANTGGGGGGAGDSNGYAGGGGGAGGYIEAFIPNPSFSSVSCVIGDAGSGGGGGGGNGAQGVIYVFEYYQ